MDIDASFNFGGLSPMEIRWRHSTWNSVPSSALLLGHFHDSCELYFHSEGSILMLADEYVFHLLPGDIAIIPPYAKHRYLITSATVNSHFTLQIPFRAAQELLGATDRPMHLRPAQGNAKRVSDLCFDGDELFASDVSPLHLTAFVLKLLAEVRDCVSALPLIDETLEGIPPQLASVLAYVASHPAAKLTVSRLCEMADVSRNTLSTYFRRYLSLTPSGYLQNARLATARRLLAEGKSVAESAAESGFPDYSHFISQFHKLYSITPLQYSKLFAQK